MSGNKNEDYLENLLNDVIEGKEPKDNLNISKMASDDKFLADMDESYDDINEERFLKDFENDIKIVSAEDKIKKEPSYKNQIMKEPSDEEFVDNLESDDLAYAQTDENDANENDSESNEFLDNLLKEAENEPIDVSDYTNNKSTAENKDSESFLDELESDDLLDLLNDTNDETAAEMTEVSVDDDELLGMLENLGNKPGEDINDDTQTYVPGDESDDEKVDKLDELQNLGSDDVGIEEDNKSDNSKEEIPEMFGDDFDLFEGLERDLDAEDKKNTSDIIQNQQSELGTETDSILEDLGLSSIVKQEEKPEKKKKRKKKGFFAKLFGKKDKNNKEESDSNEDENDKILKELEESESKVKKKGKKAQKAKSKNGKKIREKKIKPVSEPEEILPPLPKGKVVITVVMAASFILLFFLGTKYFGYSIQMKHSKDFYSEGNYLEAYNEIDGLKVNETDKKYYNQVLVMSKLSKEYDSYNNFISVEMYPQALDALIKAVGRYDGDLNKADDLDVENQYTNLYNKIVKILSDSYDVSEDEAREILDLNDKLKYSQKIYEISDGK